MGIGSAILIGFIALSALGGVIGGSGGAGSADNAAKKDRESHQTARVAAAAAAIKHTLRNPDSIKWESMRANDDASVICIEYRAQNGFGGMNKEYSVFVGDNGSPNNAEVWNKNCRKPMSDMTGAEVLLPLFDK